MKSVVVERSGSFFVGLAAILIVACGSSADNSAGPNKPPITQCTSKSQCPTGTAACIDGFCVSQQCPDNDGDGSGVGPGCTKYDCDDTDSNIPGSEVCDSKDNDCNGIVDEGCPCEDASGNTLPDGSTQPCGGGGDCQGTNKCVSGKWSAECTGAKPAQPSEVCGNDVDENCNGEKDEGCCPANESPCPGFAVCSSNGVCD